MTARIKREVRKNLDMMIKMRKDTPLELRSQLDKNIRLARKMIRTLTQKKLS